MQCFACDLEAIGQCPRCGRWFCREHGKTQCDRCRAPASLPPSSFLFRLAVTLLVLSVGLAGWHIIAWPQFPALPPRTAVEARSPATRGEDDSGARVASPPPSSVASPTATAATQARHYTITEGDSLSSIAARFGTTVSAVAEANNIADPEAIRIGQELVIP